MFNTRGMIVVSIITMVTFLLMGNVASSTNLQPIGKEFEVVSEGFEMLTACPDGTPERIPPAAEIAKHKNMIGAMIICNHFDNGNANGLMPVFMEYTRIHVSCLPYDEGFLYKAEITANWTCKTHKEEEG